MFFYVIKRLILAGLTLLVILFVSYLLLRLAPGDPTRSTLLGSDAASTQISADTAAGGRLNHAMRQKLHLDQPVYVGFCYWLTSAAQGDFGTSVTVDPGKPTVQIILERLPVTLKLNLWAILFTYSLAIPIGIIAAGKPNGGFDRTTTFIIFLLYSLPVIWVALVVQSLLCKGGYWPVFPVKGIESTLIAQQEWWRIFGANAMYYVLPVICLAYGGFAGISRYTRAGMIEVLGQDFIRTARAKGVSNTGVIFYHAFRNALITLITLFAGILPGLVAGSIIVEQIFNIPGMGSLSIMALSSRDYPLQMALFAFAGTLTLAGIFISDMLYTVADPRIKLNR